MPPEMMKLQCEKGLAWLKEGRIDGMLFLSSVICDLDIETVEWTRKWIAEVGDQPLQPKRVPAGKWRRSPCPTPTPYSPNMR